MNDKKYNYTITWVIVPNQQAQAEPVIETFKEANELINLIKSRL